MKVEWQLLPKAQQIGKAPRLYEKNSKREKEKEAIMSWIRKREENKGQKTSE